MARRLSPEGGVRWSVSSSVRGWWVEGEEPSIAQ
jgi:hypothetical protein